MKTYHKTYKIKGSPGEIYNALVKPFTISLWTGAKTQMEEKPGTEFSLFDGDINGMNIEFVPNKKIMQEWYFGDQNEKSIVTINLTEEKIYTRIELTHTNIPDDEFEDMRFGWDNYYFGGLKEFFEM